MQIHISRRAFSSARKTGAFTLLWTGRFALLLLTAACLLSPALHAQYRASIQGTVTDTTGAVIPGATLTLANNSTNERQVRTSNAEGIFNFNALPPDTFTLTVEKDGFQKQVLEKVHVVADQPNGVNVQLAVGAAAQTVSVDASLAPLLETAGASVGGEISENQIQHMPSFGRDVFQLTQLAPGVFGDGSQGSGGGAQQLPGTQGPGGTGGSAGIFQTENGPQALANGGQFENNGISVDGISTASAVWGGTSVITPSEESIGNVKVVSNSYDAENGRFSGAQIQVTSKSGTNDFHGSLFFVAHRPGLNAYQSYNGPVAAGAVTAAAKGVLRDENRFNQYGGSIGGPIWKDKIFAFFSYEASPSNSKSTTTGWYETSAFDKAAPANSIAAQFLTFAGAGVSAQGIISNTCATAGLIEGKNCATIPGQGLDVGSPLKTPLGTHDPTYGGSPTTPGVGSGLDGVADIAQFVTVNPTNISQQQYNGRLDADASSKDHVSFAIYWVPTSKTDYNGTQRAYNLYHHSQINDAFAGIWNHTFSATFLNEARVNAAGWRWNEIGDNPQAPFGLPQDNIGILNGPSNQNVGSIELQYFGPPGPSVFNQWTYSYKDVATKVAGRHTIKFGGEVTRLYYLNESTYSARPSFNFFNIWDFLNDAPQGETGQFNPLTGTPTAARQDEREDIWGFFVQDDFKVLPSLMINLGLRYSYLGPLSEKYGNLNTVVLGSGSAVVSNLSIRKGGSLWQAQKANFGPQIGFAWNPAANRGKFVLRGGFGLNYNQEEIAISGNSSGNPGRTVTPQFAIATPTSPNPGIVYAIPSNPKSLFGYPANPNTIVRFGPNGLPTTGQVSVAAYAANLPTMYTEHYSVDTQYDLGHQFVATLGYQGSLARHTYFHYEENAVAAVQGYTLNPGVSNVNFYGNGGHGNNNSMLAGLKHQFSHQFMADAEFNWSKSMDTSSAPYSEQYYPYNPSLSYGRSDYNVGKAFKLYGLYQPVFFKGDHAWLEKIAGGWSLSGIYNLHSGFPWYPVASVNGGSLYCSTCNYTQLLPGSYLGGAGHSTSNSAFKSGPGEGSGVNKNFPLAAANGNALAYFSAPAYTVAGNFPATGGALPQAPGVARNSLTGPGYKDIDGSLTKSFGLPNMPVLGENAKVEFRVDAYNLFNSLNFNPGGAEGNGSNNGGISDNLASSNFGQATKALAARVITLQARFNF
jgi:hypothetical protein